MGWDLAFESALDLTKTGPHLKPLVDLAVLITAKMRMKAEGSSVRVTHLHNTMQLAAKGATGRLVCNIPMQQKGATGRLVCNIPIVLFQMHLFQLAHFLFWDSRVTSFKLVSFACELHLSN